MNLPSDRPPDKQVKQFPFWIITSGLIVSILSAMFLVWGTLELQSDYNQISLRQQILTKNKEKIPLLIGDLSHSAKLYIYTRDASFERLYVQTSSELDSLVTATWNLLPDSEIDPIETETENANKSITQLEKKVFELIHQGENAKATSILESQEFASLKDKYSEGILKTDRIIESIIENDKKRLSRITTGITVGTAIVSLIFLLMWVLSYSTAKRWNTERNKYEEEQNRSIRQINDLYNNAPAGYHSVNKDLYFIKINNTELKWLGYTRDEVIKKIRIIDIISPKTKRTFDEKFPQLVEKGEVKNLEYYFERKDGSTFPVIFNAKAVYDDEGNFLMSNSTVIDITERKKLQDEIQKSEIRIRETLDNMLEGCMIIGYDWTYIYVNETAAKHGKQEVKNLIGKKMTEMYPGIEQTHIFRKYQQCMKERKALKFEDFYSFPDGKVNWYEFSVEPAAEGIFVLSLDITARKETENLLKDSENRYRSIVTSVSEGIVFQDKDGKIIACNPSAEKILGLSFSQQSGKTSKDLSPICVHQDGTEFPGETHPAMVTLRTGKPCYGVIMGIKIPENQINWLSINTTPIFNQGEDSPNAVVSTFTDVTEKRKSELALRKLSGAVEQSPAAIVITDDKGRIEYVNPAFEKMTRYSSAEVMGDMPRIFQPGNFPTDHAEELWKAIHDGLTWHEEIQNTKKDGEIYWENITVSPIVDERKNITSLLVIKEDVTKRKFAEEALRIANSYNRSLIEASIDPLVTIGIDGKIEDVNAATENATGISREKLVGTNFSKYFSDPEKAQAGYSIAFEKGFVRDYSLELLNKDGTRTPVLYNASVYRDSNGKIHGVFAAARDISERISSEKKIYNLNRLYSVLSQTNQMIVRIENKADLYEKACRIAIEYGNFIMAWIGVADEQTHKIKPVAKFGKCGDYLDNLDISIDDVPEGHGPTGQAIRENRHIICRDIESDPVMKPWRAKALRMGYRSSAAFPITIEGRTKGVYTVYSGEPGWFNEEEVRLLEELTSDISFAVEYLEKDEMRKKTEEDVKRSLDEKEILLKEIHHRVKNNLQIIVSLMRLQASQVTDKQTLRYLNTSQNRIRSMALVHEKLYRSQDFSNIDFEEYVKDIANSLNQIYAEGDKRIGIGFDVDKIQLSIETAIPCALIINELITNSLLHAFGNRKTGQIDITLKHCGDKYKICISDDGTGIADGLNIRDSKSLGLKLVSSLAEQIDAEISIDRGNGTAVTMMFPDKSNRRI